MDAVQGGRAGERGGEAGGGCADRNEVLLVGRLAAAVTFREMPSHDLHATWRVVVRREAPGPDSPRNARTVDTVNCGAWAPEVRREASTWQAGDRVEVRGTLRRRFWRVGTVVHSSYEVEARDARRVPQAGGADDHGTP